jgi:hypothetical protein
MFHTVVSTIRQADTARPGSSRLAHHLQAKFVKPAERAQVRAHEGSVRHVVPIGHPRREQVSS